ncbi:hypothetical protein MBLNU459_g2623t2 [Dothideomycetes sp. NU459]
MFGRAQQNNNYDHPGSNQQREPQNRFSALSQPDGRNTGAGFGVGARPPGPGRADHYQPSSSQNQPVPYLITKEGIRADLTTEKPQWPFSAYGPGRDAPRQLFGGFPLEQSFEEMRVLYYLAAASGNTKPAEQSEQDLLAQSAQQINQVLNDLDGAVKYILDGKDQHPNRLDMCLSPQKANSFNLEPPKEVFGQPSSVSAQPAFGAPSQSTAFGKPSGLGQAAGFGQPSALGRTPTFGQPAAPGGAFGQPSALGQGGGFGQPSTLGQKPAFGQPTAPGGAFGQPSALGSNSTFGQVSAPGATSAFGQASVPRPVSAFGQASAPGQVTSTFGQASNIAQSSPFSQAGASSTFGQPNQSSPFARAGSAQPATSFGQPSAIGGSQPPASFGQSTFGQPSQPQQGNSSPFAQQTQPQPPQSSPFGQAQGTSTFGQPIPSTSASPFAQAQQAAPSPFAQVAKSPASSPFAPSPAPAANPFSAPSAAAEPSPFAQAAAPQPNGTAAPAPSGPTTSPDISTYTTHNPNGTLRTWKNAPVTYIDQVPHYRQPDGTMQRIFHPNLPTSANKDCEDPPDMYNAVLEAAYAFVREAGAFKDGIMPEEPPRREWIRWDV